MANFEDLEKHYDLTPRQWRAVYLLATPGHAPFDDIAAQCGVSRKTLWTWRKQGAFYEAVKAVVRRMVGVEQHADMVEVLLKRAKRGDVQALKTYFAWQRDLAAFGVNVDVDVGVDREPLEVNIILSDGPEESSEFGARLREFCHALLDGRMPPALFIMRMVAALIGGTDSMDRLKSILVGHPLDAGKHPPSAPLPAGDVIDAEVVEPKPKPMNLSQSCRKRFMDSRPTQNRNRR